VGKRVVLGHKVAYCTWNEYTGLVEGFVSWGKKVKTITSWAHTNRSTVCANNGNTYEKNLTPNGPVRSKGVWITKRNKSEPVFGFVGRRIVFGWKNVLRSGSRNVMSGKAYLVRNGVAITKMSQAPYSTHAQFYCGPRGTDAWYGCFRSAVVSFKNGRVGLVSISLASMPVAGKILKKMGVVNAITGDAGGGEEYWAEGHTFGTIPNKGPHSAWKRKIPDAIMVIPSGCIN